jgi:hypothetical protein
MKERNGFIKIYKFGGFNFVEHLDIAARLAKALDAHLVRIAKQN